ncbi:MAG: chromate transporter [Chloroflexi bacterium]|nr:MAG: chromate transporter [Chloroflexota bacterium]
MPLDLLWRLFLASAQVGIFGYGGGPSMIPLFKQEVVDSHGWLSPQAFADSYAIGNALPGPIATKMSAYLGYRLAGLPGATAGLLGMVLPSVLLMLAFAAVLLMYKDAPVIKGALQAARPVVVGWLVWTVYDI